MQYKVKPSAETIKDFVDTFNQERYYDAQSYTASIELAKAFFKNDSFRNIFIKVNYINGAFKTTIGDTFGVSKIIYERVKDIDKRLKEGDFTLIKEIARYKTRRGKKARNNYSFATKFCHCHYPKKFPICDQYVRNSLYEFNKYHKYSEFTKKDLYDYMKLNNVLNDFKKWIGDKKIDFAVVDRFLWALGKARAEKERKKKNRLLEKAKASNT